MLLMLHIVSMYFFIWGLSGYLIQIVATEIKRRYLIDRFDEMKKGCLANATNGAALSVRVYVFVMLQIVNGSVFCLCGNLLASIYNFS